MSDKKINMEIQKGMSHRTLNGLFWTFSGTGTLVCLRTLILMILARLLTPSDFGIVSTALMIVGFFQVFARLGVGPAVIQSPNLTDDHLRNGFTLSIILGPFFLVFIWLASPAIASLFKMDELTRVLQFASLTFILTSPSIVAESLMCRHMRFRALSSIRVVSYALGYGLVGGTLAWLQFGVWALVNAQLTQVSVESLVIIVLQRHPKRLALKRNILSELLGFGIPLSFSKIANQLALQGDYLVVSRWLGHSALGFYSRAYQLMAMPANVFGDAVGKVLFPAMSRIQGESKRLALVYRRGIAITAGLALPGSAIMFILAPEIVRVLLGPQWLDATAPLRILALGVFFRVGYKISSLVLLATGRVRCLAWLQVTYAILVMIGAYAGQHFGITGVAVAIVAVLIAQFSLSSYFGNKVVSIKSRELLRALRPGAIGLLVLGTLALVAATVARIVGFTDLLTLLFTLSAVVIALILMVAIAPNNLGEDFVWWLTTVQEHLPVRLRVFNPSRT